MQRYQHRLAVIRPNTSKLFLRVKRRSRRELLVKVLVLRNNKVDSKSAGVGLVVGVKDLSLVVDLRAVLLDGCVHGLEMAVEKKGVHLTFWHGGLDDLEEVGLRAIFPG